MGPAGCPLPPFGYSLRHTHPRSAPHTSHTPGCPRPPHTHTKPSQMCPSLWQDPSGVMAAVRVVTARPPTNPCTQHPTHSSPHTSGAPRALNTPHPPRPTPQERIQHPTHTLFAPHRRCALNTPHIPRPTPQVYTQHPTPSLPHPSGVHSTPPTLLAPHLRCAPVARPSRSSWLLWGRRSPSLCGRAARLSTLRAARRRGTSSGSAASSRSPPRSVSRCHQRGSSRRKICSSTLTIGECMLMATNAMGP
mmetsp:Transcript_2727/g.7378  ORF Transcript_2727/g.7378 Transcript_2727/m.7378 type:complete len:249 (-) Transcript_2727:72-818(-)